MAWNEPNNPVFLKPQYRRSGTGWAIQSGRDYAKICNAVVQGVKSVQRSSKVACGATGPRGNNNPNSSRPSVSPLPFLRAMKQGGAKGFDAYAHHPYYGSPAETPTTKPPPGKRGQPSTAVTLGNFDVLVEGDRPALRQRDADLGHGVRLPDEPARQDLRRHLRKQAHVPDPGGRLGETNPRVDIFLWFLLTDEQRLGGWQSGLTTVDGKRKASFRAFQKAVEQYGT